MSRFFRSADSSSSSSSEEDVSAGEEVSRGSGDTENIANGISQLSVSGQGPSSQNENSQMLLHALLEERCMNEVIREFEEANGRQRRPEDYEALHQAAQTRYRRICTELNSLNILSPGFEQDYHSPTRQAVRNGLNLISRTAAASTSRSTAPATSTRLLTDATFDPMTSPYTALLSRQSTSTSSAFDDLSPPSNHVMSPSRYRRDFDELGILGKGGYGMVFHVKHKLDDIHYAIKKVPISPARIARIRTRGPAELEDLTREVRTLARLDHPNIVRYHNAWIEWSDVGRVGTASNTPETARNVQESDADSDVGANVRFEDSLQRVTTQSDSHNTGIVFEHSVSQRQLAQVSFSAEASSSMLFSNSSLADGILLRTSEPTLALHLQMGLYPLTLAAFISPPQTTTPIEPLTHCFHLQPTLSIMLALLNGVEYLHSQNIIHRDLKPANIFVAANPTPHASYSHTHSIDLSNCHPCLTSNKPNPASLSLRIGDFGLVTELTQPLSPSSSSPSPAPTPINTAVGTEIYRPLQPSSPATTPIFPAPNLDLFSLGVIFFELLYPCSTKMERHDVICSLKRNGEFPRNFGEKLGCSEKEVVERIKGAIAEMLCLHAGEGKERNEEGGKDFVTLKEVRGRLEDVSRMVDDGRGWMG